MKNIEFEKQQHDPEKFSGSESKKASETKADIKETLGCMYYKLGICYFCLQIFSKVSDVIKELLNIDFGHIDLTEVIEFMAHIFRYLQ
jgi:hypothetical protein